MDVLKLLPRGYRYFGLILTVPTFFIFLIDSIYFETGITVGGSFFDSSSDFFTRTVYNLVAFQHGEIVFFKEIKNNLINEFGLAIMLLGSWMLAFARIKGEDEFSQQLRLQSMSSALVWNSALLLLFNFLFYDGMFFFVMITQLFSFSLIFSIIFALKIRKYRKGLSNEE